MKVIDWRKKHKRCRFCKHFHSRLVGIDCVNLIECRAKDIPLHYSSRGPFCRLYEVKEEP